MTAINNDDINPHYEFKVTYFVNKNINIQVNPEKRGPIKTQMFVILIGNKNNFHKLNNIYAVNIIPG